MKLMTLRLTPESKALQTKKQNKKYLYKKTKKNKKYLIKNKIFFIENYTGTANHFRWNGGKLFCLIFCFNAICFFKFSGSISDGVRGVSLLTRFVGR